MRLLVETVINVTPSKYTEKAWRADSRDSFWNAYLGDRRSSLEERRYDIDSIEGRIRNEFGDFLEGRLQNRLFLSDRKTNVEYSKNQTLVFVRGISYGSLKILTEIVTPSLSALGLTSDDFIEILNRYTPSALSHAVEAAPDGNLEVRSTGKVIQADAPSIAQEKEYQPQSTPASPSSGRLDKFWMIANTSLVLPALVLLMASFLIFQNASEERSRIIAALMQERVELASERQKIMDRYADQLKGFRDFLSDQAKHISNFNEIEARSMQDRLNQAKNRSEK